MKAAIPIPPKLAGRPRWRGLPIPAVATIKPDGEPDFRVTDEWTRLHVLMDRRCQLCGQALGRNLFFVGGPKSAEALLYFEPPAHLDCLLYAMQVCPFIAGSIEHEDLAKVQAENPTIKVQIDATFTTVKSEDWVIVKASDFLLVRSPGTAYYARPEPVLFKTAPLRAAQMDATDWGKIRQQLFYR